MYVYMSVRWQILKTICQIFMNFSVHVICGRGCGLALTTMQYTSGFVDNAMFGDNRPRTTPSARILKVTRKGQHWLPWLSFRLI